MVQSKTNDHVIGNDGGLRNCRAGIKVSRIIDRLRTSIGGGAYELQLTGTVLKGFESSAAEIFRV